MVTAVVFEGGGRAVSDPVQATMVRLREAVTLDTVDKLCGCPGIARVVLCTDRPALAAAARRLGAVASDTSGPFHLGRQLLSVCEAMQLERVLYMGGTAAPLISQQEIARVVRLLVARERCVVVNNPQSADLVAFTPALVLRHIDLPSSDNLLGWLLQEAGLERVLMPSSPAVHFDLDTPADFLVMAISGRAGPRAHRALQDVCWSLTTLEWARRVLAQPYREVALVGRVGTPVMDYLNATCRVRLRVFSEERGMKALGRDARGEVDSLVGRLIEAMGPEDFFAQLAAVSDAVFFDTRVVFAHAGRQVTERDRFCSDLGLAEAIEDEFVRRLTRAALAARVPVVLGGHTVVSGGLQVLAESIRASTSV